MHAYNIPKYLPIKGCGDHSLLLEKDTEVKEREGEDSHDFSNETLKQINSDLITWNECY